MPGRKTPLVTDEIYHVFNRGIDHRLTFPSAFAFTRTIELLKFYRFDSAVKFSTLRLLTKEIREKIIADIQATVPYVEIICYCLMPNHFHLCLRQKRENGISKFMSDFQNSYTRYFNTKENRVGPIFLDQFKAVRIETDEQLLHVSRYIHLNPYSSYIVKTLLTLKEYKWSSFSGYIRGESGFCDKGPILSFFKTAANYENFVFDNADYQRTLEGIKHLLIEE